VREEIADYESDPEAGTILDDRRRELGDLGRERTRHAAEASVTLAAYQELSANLQRIRSVASRLLTGAALDPLPIGVARRLVLETTTLW
jgi:hypothetical protein